MAVEPTISEKLLALNPIKTEMWAYYLRSQDLRKEVLDYYIKIVAIPVPVVVGLVALARVKEAVPEIPSNILFGVYIFLFLLILAGHYAFLYFCAETQNAGRYLHRVKEIEKVILDLANEKHETITWPMNARRLSWDSLIPGYSRGFLYFRAMVLGFTNAGLLALVVASLAGVCVALFGVIALLGLQYYQYRHIVQKGNSPKPEKKDKADA
ncbi:MAG TPA: hypothetical protein VIN05_04330 [Roseovarius sp.]